jgi:cytochrome c peroxidase
MRSLLSRVTLITGSVFLLGAAETPNTGMADPAALINAFDQYAAKLPANGRFLKIPLTTLRGITAESFNAGGDATIDLTLGTVDSSLTGLPLSRSFDLWLVDNRPSPGHSTLADLQDVRVNVGSYHVESGTHKLTVSLGQRQFINFLPDRAFVTASGQSPLNSFVLTGSATIFDRLFHRQVRFVDDPGAAAGFDPSAAATRLSNFSKIIAQGRQVFLKEKFAGNGRSCGTCHVENNNFTIDPAFISTLPQSDPLFVAETNPALADLERPELMRKFGLVLVNADGFDKGFVLRATQNVQALRNSTTPQDPSYGIDFSTNGRNPNPPERLGWGNDAAPLRDFAIVAIAQHFPRTMNRTRGSDFRVPTDEELDALAAYQLALGRQEDFDLTTLQLNSVLASKGKALFLDSGNIALFVPGDTNHKNCMGCHFNAGGTAGMAFNPNIHGFPKVDGSPAGFNIAFATNANEIPLALSFGLPRDGGFGLIPTVFRSFGNTDDLPPMFGGHLELEEFNSPPLVEAADTGPYFHNHTVKTLEEAVAFYGTPAFQSSIGNRAIPVKISDSVNDPEVQAIAAFLRVLNALENIRSSIEAGRRGSGMTREEDAHDLAALALAECIDALEVLSAGALTRTLEPGILSARANLVAASLLLGIARYVPRPAVDSLLQQAVIRLQSARSELAVKSSLPPSYQK